MLRRFNYTGRERLRRENVGVRLSNSGSVRDFEARVELSEYAFPPEASVFVEAYEKAALMRFDFGTVANVVAPTDRRLTVFEGSEAIRFRVKVVDTAQKKILAEADSIIPWLSGEEEQKRQPLLPICGADLGERLWKVEFREGNQDLPTLLINNRITDKVGLVRSPEFMALALPAVLREILNHILVVEKHFELDDESDWKCHWLKFGRQFLHPPADPPSGNDESEQTEWIDQAIEGFCSRFGLFTQFTGNSKAEGV